MKLISRVAFFCLTVIVISGCQLTSKPGGYYQDDGPPTKADFQRVSSAQDAVPIVLPLSKTGNRPYTALGNSYTPLERGVAYHKVGNASWYGKKYHGRRTSSGETYDMYQMTAAHPVLPLPSFVRVTNLDNNRAVIVKVNDRGPFLGNRIIDLSYAAAVKLDMLGKGTARVEVQLLDPAKNALSAKSNDLKPVSRSNLNPTKTVNQQYKWIQVGAFTQVANAQELLAQLSAKLSNASIKQTLNAAGAAIFQVQLGPYLPTQIDEASERLRALGYSSLLIK